MAGPPSPLSTSALQHLDTDLLPADEQDGHLARLGLPEQRATEDARGQAGQALPRHTLEDGRAVVAHQPQRLGGGAGDPRQYAAADHGVYLIEPQRSGSSIRRLHWRPAVIYSNLSVGDLLGGRARVGVRRAAAAR